MAPVQPQFSARAILRKMAILEKKVDEPEIPVWSDEEVSTQLAEILVTWPLYRKLQYRNANVHNLPTRISRYCDHRLCKTVQQWSAEQQATTRVVGAVGGTPDLRREIKSYTCRNCRVSSVKYFYWWFIDPTDGISTFYKVGEYPPLTAHLPDALKNNFDKEDADFYQKAIRLRNHNLGIAAIAYLRRVVENRINDMLDVLAQAAREQEHPVAEEELKKIGEIKAARRLDAKIDYAAKLLPEHLKPANLPNPIDILHELASDGLHARSEEECVDIFDGCKEVFEFVFGNLKVKSEEAKNFIESLKRLSQRKAQGETEKK